MALPFHLARACANAHNETNQLACLVVLLPARGFRLRFRIRKTLRRSLYGGLIEQQRRKKSPASTSEFKGFSRGGGGGSTFYRMPMGFREYTFECAEAARRRN